MHIKKLLISGAILYLGCVCLLLVNSRNDNIVDADYAIVYGNTVNPDGSLSHRLKVRVDAAIALYNQSKIKTIVVSGGLGKEGHDEAVVMANYINTHGIDSVIIDSQGYNTHMTSVNAKALLPINARVVAVSQYFHLPRAKLSLKHAGFENVYGYAPAYYDVRDIYSVTRELLAYLKYKITKT